MSPNSTDSAFKITVTSLTFSPLPLPLPRFWPSPPLSATSFFPLLSVPSGVVSTQNEVVIPFLCLYTLSDSLLLLAFNPNSPDPFKFPVAFSRFIFNHLFSCLSCPGDAESFTAPRRAHDDLRPEVSCFLPWPVPTDHLKQAHILPCQWGFSWHHQSRSFSVFLYHLLIHLFILILKSRLWKMLGNDM